VNNHQLVGRYYSGLSPDSFSRHAWSLC